MSHYATNWALQQRGLKPATKIVLWHLFDRLNPDQGCFPSQNRLTYDSEISRSTLNDHLGNLETAGLLRRVPRIDPATKRQLRQAETGPRHAGTSASAGDQVNGMDSRPRQGLFLCAGRDVSTTLRQRVFELRLGFSRCSLADW